MKKKGKVVNYGVSLHVTLGLNLLGRLICTCFSSVGYAVFFIFQKLFHGSLKVQVKSFLTAESRKKVITSIKYVDSFKISSCIPFLLDVKSV